MAYPAGKGSNSIRPTMDAKNEATLTRLTVAFSSGQMYAVERDRRRKWKFRFD
jgi:hypothetical protein